MGWGKDYRNEDFVAQAGVKHQLVNLISSVQTLLRGEANSCPNSLCKQRVIVFSILYTKLWFGVDSETSHKGGVTPICPVVTTGTTVMILTVNFSQFDC